MFMSGVIGDEMKGGLLTVEVLIEDKLFLDNLIIVDSGESVLSLDSRFTSVSLTGFNPLLSTL